MSKDHPIALIIGISGQDGSYLAHLLLEKGYQVVGTSRDHELGAFSNLTKLGIREQVRLRSVSLSDFRSVITSLEAIQPDEIYNLSGQTSVNLSFHYPVETFDSISVGTINILECIRFLKRPVRFYNAGSSEVFGNTLQPATEKTPFQPRSPYATAKAAAHFSVTNYREAYDLYACTGILFNHESPLRPERFVTSKIVSTAIRIARGSDERLQLGNLEVSRDWGWAPEYVEAMWRMLQQGEPADYVIATGKTNSLSAFVSEAFSQLGLNWKDHVDLIPSLLRPTDISESAANPAQAHKMLNWRAETYMESVIEKLIAGNMEAVPK